MPETPGKTYPTTPVNFCGYGCCNPAGFPLDPEILNYEEWLDLGRVNQCFQAHERAANRMFQVGVGLWFVLSLDKVQGVLKIEHTLYFAPTVP